MIILVDIIYKFYHTFLNNLEGILPIPCEPKTFENAK